MKVESANFNIFNASNLPNNTQVNRSISKQSFTGGIAPSVLADEINKLNTPFLKGVNRLRNNIGEFQDICLNALGTGFLAPLFIKYNPLSHTDEDTRTYSAWRQPLSAGLAIVTQGGITIPFVALINHMTNSGWFNEKCNKSPFKDEKYIYRTIKKLNPKLNKSQINEKVKSYIDAQKKSLIDNLRQNNTIYYQYNNSPYATPMNSEKFKNLLNKTIEDMLKEEKDELARCKGEKLKNRIERSDFYRTHYDTCKSLFTDIENKISSAGSVKEISDYLKAKYKTLKTQKADPHLLEILKEIKAYEVAGKEGFLYKVQKMQDAQHLEGYKGMKTRREVEEKVAKNLAGRISEQEDIIEFLEKVKQSLSEGKTVSDIEEMFAQKVKEFKNKGKEFKLHDKIFSEEVIEKLKSLTQSHIDGVKRISTLLVALAMLPVSCSILNWVYPRFMDAVFPNLSSKKHNNESKELVDKATKNSEVK